MLSVISVLILDKSFFLPLNPPTESKWDIICTIVLTISRQSAQRFAYHDQDVDDNVLTADRLHQNKYKQHTKFTWNDNLNKQDIYLYLGQGFTMLWQITIRKKYFNFVSFLKMIIKKGYLKTFNNFKQLKSSSFLMSWIIMSEPLWLLAKRRSTWLGK